VSKRLSSFHDRDPHRRESNFRNLKTDSKILQRMRSNAGLSQQQLVLATQHKPELLVTYILLHCRAKPYSRRISQIRLRKNAESTHEIVIKAVRTPVSYTLRAKDQFLGCAGAFLSNTTMLSCLILRPRSPRHEDTSSGTCGISRRRGGRCQACQARRKICCESSDRSHGMTRVR
jgi:hypothetical protein